MAFALKNLASGQLPDAKGALYTVPAGTSAVVKTISYVNTSIVGMTVNLYVNPAAGSSKYIIPKDMTLENSFVFDSVVTLGSGDLLEGDAAVASTVDYVISGVEES